MSRALVRPKGDVIRVTFSNTRCVDFTRAEAKEFADKILAGDSFLWPLFYPAAENGVHGPGENFYIFSKYDSVSFDKGEEPGVLSYLDGVMWGQEASPIEMLGSEIRQMAADILAALKGEEAE
jgi:hypothetical protein